MAATAKMPCKHKDPRTYSKPSAMRHATKFMSGVLCLPGVRCPSCTAIPSRMLVLSHLWGDDVPDLPRAGQISMIANPELKPV